jgi:hypothetical protein
MPYQLSIRKYERDYITVLMHPAALNPPNYLNASISSDIAPCSQYVNRRFGGKYFLHFRGRKSDDQETSL